MNLSWTFVSRGVGGREVGAPTTQKRLRSLLDRLGSRAASQDGLRRAGTALALGVATVWPVGLQAQDEERELGWSLEAELSSVFTGGNQSSRTFGAAATLQRLGERSDFTFRGATVFQESGLKTRRAVGSPDSFVLEEDKNTERTAESYNLRARYDYRFFESAYVMTGADWLRNTFAGISSRFLYFAGAGNQWVDRASFRFKTDVSLTYTFQTDVVVNPFVKHDFPGIRGGYELFWSLTSSADFESELVADWNLKTTEDFRMDWTNALPVSISSRLALKPSLRLLWRTDPALTSVDLFDTVGAPTGETVLVPLGELDTFFTLALVVTL